MTVLKLYFEGMAQNVTFPPYYDSKAWNADGEEQERLRAFIS